MRSMGHVSSQDRGFERIWPEGVKMELGNIAIAPGKELSQRLTWRGTMYNLPRLDNNSK